MKRINEGQPAVRVFWVDPGFRRPVRCAVRRLDLGLRKMEPFQLRAGQGIQCQHDASRVFNLMRPGDQAGAGTTRQQRDAGVDTQNLQRCLGVRKEFWRHENESE